MTSVMSSMHMHACRPDTAPKISQLGARPAVSRISKLQASGYRFRDVRNLRNTARGVGTTTRAAGRADEQDPGWWDTPVTSNFIDVTSEAELRDVMRAAYGNERASTLLVVEFYGKWCNSCRRLYPALKKLAKREQDVLFVKIDFDNCKDLCRKLGVVKLPYFHVYNGSGSRLADFASSLDPVKFKRLTDAIETNKSLRCVLKPGETQGNDSNAPSTNASLVKLHHVTFNWRGGGTHVMIAGDVAGGWTHTLSLKNLNADSDDTSDSRVNPQSNTLPSPTHSVTAILPTGTFRFKFIVDGEWVTEGSYPTVSDRDSNENNEVFVGPASWPFEWVRVPGSEPAGPPGRTDAVPVALTELTPSDAIVKLSSGTVNITSTPSGKTKTDGGFLDARSSDPPLNKTAMAPGRTKPNVKPSLAAPVSPGIARVEADTAMKASSKPFDPDVKPPPSKATKPKPFEIKKIAVSADSFSTRSEHEKKVAEETAQAFRALEFRRKEEWKQNNNVVKPQGPYSDVGLAPSKAPVPVATKEAASKQELLTLEDRVKRLEEILESHGIGTEDMPWEG